jgi:putative ABC transport system substrate-binding protein
LSFCISLASLASFSFRCAVFAARNFVAAGGLISYGPEVISQPVHAADYVDRILKGEKPADFPMQGPTKYELVINLKSAKALRLDVPPTLLARACGAFVRYWHKADMPL